MKRIFFSIAVSLIFGLWMSAQPAFVLAQDSQANEQAQIQELQAIINQLLVLLAELQKQVVLAAQQSYVSVSGPACGQAEIAWARVSGASEYVLYRNGIEAYSGRNTKFTDTDLFLNTQYTYTLRAKNAGGLGNASPLKTVTTPSECPPAAPAVWGQAGACGGTVHVWWSRTSGASFYEVFRGNTRAASLNSLAFIDRGLGAARSYPYKIRGGNSGGLGEFSEPVTIQASAICPPDAPEDLEVGVPFLDDTLAEEGVFVVSIHSRPSGVTVESEGSAKAILGFRASAEHSDIFIERLDVDFSDRAWLFLKEVRVLDGSRAVSTIEVSQNSFATVGDNTYRISFSGLAIQVPKGRSKTISVAVSAKDNLGVLQTRQIQVSIPVNSVRGRDQINVPHFGPAAAAEKPFFVKRKAVNP